MEEEQGLAEHFYSKLQDKANNSGVVLAQFYSTYYEQDLNSELIPFFGKLVKLYGKNMTFQALLDLFDFEDVKHDNIRRLIMYLVKRRIEGKFSLQETVDLTKDVQASLKELKKAKKQTTEGVENPFDE